MVNRKEKSRLTPQQKADGNFYIVKACFHLRNAQFYFQEVKSALEGNMRGGTKEWFKEMNSRMQYVWVSMYGKLSPDSKSHLEKELEDARNFDSITNIALALPQEYRDRLELEAEALYNQYKIDPKYKNRLETFNNEEVDTNTENTGDTTAEAVSEIPRSENG